MSKSTLDTMKDQGQCVIDYIKSIMPEGTIVENTVTEDGTNAVKSSGIYTYGQTCKTDAMSYNDVKKVRIDSNGTAGGWIKVASFKMVGTYKTMDFNFRVSNSGAGGYSIYSVYFRHADAATKQQTFKCVYSGAHYINNTSYHPLNDICFVRTDDDTTNTMTYDLYVHLFANWCGFDIEFYNIQCNGVTMDFDSRTKDQWNFTQSATSKYESTFYSEKSDGVTLPTGDVNINPTMNLNQFCTNLWSPNTINGTSKNTIQEQITALNTWVGTVNTSVGTTAASTLQSAKDYADGKDADTLQSAKDYTDTGLSGKQNTMSAGTGITLNNDEISVNTGIVASGNNLPVTGDSVYNAISSATPNIDAGAGISKSTSGSTITLSTNISATGPLKITNGTGTEKIIAADFDAAPTLNSTNLVNSGNIQKYVDEGDNAITELLSTSASTSDKCPTTSEVNTAISSAINDLDVASVGGSTKYIESISEANGKITAVEKSFGSIANNNAYPVTGGAVYTALNGKENTIPSVTWTVTDGVITGVEA